jgi:multidrug efflux pump subunit AcrA (membrane-fusion protein)
MRVMSAPERPSAPQEPDAIEPLPDGEEAPPPGVRTMAAVRWGLVALMALAAVGTWSYRAGQQRGGHAEAAATYRCPMHPAVLQATPGSCPICGMDLVLTAGGAHAAPPTDGPAAPAASAGRFWCPMHPEVASDDPAARCEKCGGMKLVPRPAPAEKGVPGLVAVELDAARAQRIGLRTARVERRRLGAEVRTLGVVTVNEAGVVTVTARVTGWVDELVAKRAGDRVARGAPLVTLYSNELVSGLQQVLAVPRDPGQPPEGAKTVNRAFGIDAVKRMELLGMAAEDVARVRETGQVPYAQPVRSPIAGRIARRSAFAGQYVQPGTELFQIVDLSTVWVVVRVPDAEAWAVRPGQRATATLASRPDAPVTGVVEAVYPAVDADDRSVQARVVLRNDDERLRPGATAEVVLKGEPVEALSVPEDALVDTGEHRYVFVLGEGGRYEPRAVRAGLRAGGRVQVLEGLAEGEQVVTAATFLVDSESRLRAAEQPPAPGAAAMTEHARADRP